MDGHTISGLDAQGNEVFSHTYHKLDEENENGFLFYQSDELAERMENKSERK